MDLYKITAVANTIGTLLTTGARNGARVENPFPNPIYLSTSSPFTASDARICIAAAGANGPTEYVFDAVPYQDWYYLTASSGAFDLQVW